MVKDMSSMQFKDFFGLSVLCRAVLCCWMGDMSRFQEQLDMLGTDYYVDIGN